MFTEIPEELVDQIHRGNTILFLGPDIERSIPGELARPTARSLAQELVWRCAYSEPEVVFSKVAQYYEMEHGRQSLLQFLIDRINDYRYEPLLAHRLVVQLPIKTIVTTNYDCLLERELDRNRKPYVRVIGNEELGYLDENKVLLVKMSGSIESPQSLVVTEDDLWAFFQKLPAVSIVLKALFATKTLLFVGYDLSDQNFKRIYTEITSSIDRHQRRAYAVQQEPSDYDLRWWERRNIAIIRNDVCSFLTALLERLASRQATVPFAHVGGHVPEQPYKFLDYFEQKDVSIFFGRDQESEDMIKRILAHKVSVLYGASGTGKTSLILAGIIPNLPARGYEYVYVRALQDPELTIKEQIRSLRLPELSSTHPDETTLGRFLEVFLPVNSRWVIFLDQFEEFFIRQGSAVRQRLASALRDSVSLEAQDIRFVLSIRDDYLARLDQLEEYLPTIFGNKYRLGNLDANRTRVAISEPARLFGLDFEPVLLDELIKDLEGGGFEPTQIQIVCHKLFQTMDRRRSVFTLEAYRELGSGEGILTGYLNDLLMKLKDETERDAARGILKSMVTAEATKEALSAQEIARDTIVRKLGIDEAKVVSVLEELRENRVIRKLAEPELYELAHDVLVRKVWEWISQEDIIFKYTRAMIRQGLTDWKQLGVLLDPEKRRLINKHKEILSLTSDEMELIFWSAVEAGEETTYWLNRAMASELDVWKIGQEILQTAPPQTRHNMVSLLLSRKEKAIDLLETALQTQYPALIRQARRILKTYPSYLAGQVLEQYPPPEVMLLIERGECTIGQDKSPMQEQTEEPAHNIFIQSFSICKYPVTNIEYEQFVTQFPHPPPDHWKGGTCPPGKADHPVTYVSWYDAIEYCRWLSTITGNQYRLPSEAEWEKAASWDSSKGTRRIYPYGNTYDPLKCNTAESGIGDTTPIGQFSSAGGDSPSGCSDMAGNVWEWTSTRATDDEDRFYRYPYDPKDGREDLDVTGMRVVRGGSFNYSSRASRCSARAWRNAEYRSWHYGFRVALSVDD